MARKAPNPSLANALGALGYCSVALQWFWAFLVTIYPIMTSNAYWMAPSTPDAPAPEPTSFDIPDPIAAVITAIVVLIVFGVSIYMLAALPKRIGQAGKAVTQKAATTIVPIITEHRKISEKKRRKLTVRTVFVIKLLLVVIPLAIPYLMPGMTTVAPEVLAVLGLFGVLSSASLFGLQYIVARAMRVPATQLW